MLVCVPTAGISCEILLPLKQNLMERKAMTTDSESVEMVMLGG
jgi:hypothetical protein